MGSIFRSSQRESRELAPWLGGGAIVFGILTGLALGARIAWPDALGGMLTPLVAFLGVGLLFCVGFWWSFRSFGREDD